MNKPSHFNSLIDAVNLKERRYSEGIAYTELNQLMPRNDSINIFEEGAF